MRPLLHLLCLLIWQCASPWNGPAQGPASYPPGEKGQRVVIHADRPWRTAGKCSVVRMEENDTRLFAGNVPLIVTSNTSQEFPRAILRAEGVRSASA